MANGNGHIHEPCAYLKSSVYAELFGVPGGNRKERSDGIARSSPVKAVLYDERHADETAGNGMVNCQTKCNTFCNSCSNKSAGAL